MQTLKSSYCILVAGVLFFSACRKHQREPDRGASPTSNNAPVASAGADQVITLPINSALLDGSGSADPDNNISSFSWKKISGPVSAQIVSPGSIKTFVNELVQGDYQFELKVTDSTNLISRDTVNIKVATGPTPPSTSKTVRALIIEHGTNIPVAGAVLFICTSPIDYFRCAANYLNVVTDANGFANFKADSFRYSHVEAADYWQNIFEPCFVSYFRNKTLLVKMY